MRAIESCGIGEDREFHSLWSLPKLPLTERFGPYKADQALAYDQELLISVPTGHVQLRYQLDPKLLYTDSDYSFRTGASDKSRAGVNFFTDFLKRYTSDHTFNSIVDVGGNDLFLARMLSGQARHSAVIDPICQPIDGRVVDGILVLGRFIEQVDLSRDLPPADLVVCRHTLEHVARPRDVIDQWFRECDPDCLYALEVPCFENLVEAQRFDAIFHQHFHYYDLAAFRRLIWECGGEYLGHAFNHQGSCGGALLVAFRRARKPQAKPEIDLEARIARIERRLARYREQMAMMAEFVTELPKPVYGYGAGLMLATLGYHLKTNFLELECILDDDPDKDGLTYENVPVTVRHTGKMAPPPNSSYLITSLENVRPIYRRIQELTPRRIVIPLIS